MDLGIDGRIALVTGASKGLGLGIARALGAEGVIGAVHDEIGPVEILVVNTGGPPAGDPLSFTREQWEAAYRSLVLSPMALIERAVPAMRERGWGRVVNVSSNAVREPIPYLMLSNAHRSA